MTVEMGDHDATPTLRQRFAETLDSDEVRRYDDVRWGDEE